MYTNFIVWFYLLKCEKSIKRSLKERHNLVKSQILVTQSWIFQLALNLFKSLCIHWSKKKINQATYFDCVEMLWNPVKHEGRELRAWGWAILIARTLLKRPFLFLVLECCLLYRVLLRDLFLQSSYNNPH